MSHIESNRQVILTWKGLTAYAKEKILLDNCEGYCQPGEMLAIMGPSGAGKTTLLSILSKRSNPSLAIKGDILANGQSFTQQFFNSFGTFVYQNDLLFSTLTVRQTLEFIANLKSQNKEDGQAQVDKLLKEFELQKIQHTYVGSQAVKGISGGEKKRVCIAVEMVSKPSLIILDQPTSGLDSNKAAKVLSILKKLTIHRHTVIFTLHQPSYLQYAKLDRLILLNRGQTVYQGPAQAIGPYMESVGISVSNKMTISDFFMLQISEYKKDNDGYDTPLNYQNYSSKLSSEIQAKVDHLNIEKESLGHFSDIYMASFLVAFGVLLKREWSTYWRDRAKFGSVITTSIVRFLLIGVAFKDSVPSKQVIDVDPTSVFFGIQSIAFMCIVSTGLTNTNAISLTIPYERQLFYKQTDSKKYSVLPYYLSKAIVFYIANGLGSLFFCVSSYWFHGWTNDFQHWFNFTLIILVFTATGNSVGLVLATMLKRIKNVSAMSGFLIIPMMALAGLYKKLDNLPVWINWMQYLTPFRYGFQLVMQNEFGDQKFGPGGNFDYQKEYGYTLDYTQNFLTLLGLTFGFYLFGFVMLKYNTDKIVA